jgi:hypothetical protein
MHPSLPPVDHGLAIGIDGTALAEILHGFAQLIPIGKVIVKDPLLDIDPVLSPYPDNLHGNHHLSK